MKSEHSYTIQNLANDDAVITCNDCGAYLLYTKGTPNPQVKHYKTCQPGESKKWKEFYEEEN